MGFSISNPGVSLLPFGVRGVVTPAATVTVAISTPTLHVAAPPSLTTAVASSVPAPPPPSLSKVELPSTPLSYGFELRTAPDALVSEWRTSSDPRLRALAVTVPQARAAYADAMAGGARVFVSTSVGNGYFPVLTLVGPACDLSKPIAVHTHYHGFGSVVADRFSDSGRAQIRMREVQAANPQVVFVLPECRNASPVSADQTPLYRTDWSNVRDQVVTTADALKASGAGPVTLRTVSFFSGGGAAFANLQKSRPDGSALAADRLELIDCLYNDTHDRVVLYATTANGRAVSRVRFIRGFNEWPRVNAVKAAFGARFELIDVSRDGAKTNRDALRPDNSPYLDATGKRLPRFADFSNLHVRSRAEFLDSSR